jgi:hypothetical protein
MLQLNPTLPMDTPKGSGRAHFVIDAGQEHHVVWGVVIDATGEVWWFEHPDVRVQANPTIGRPEHKPDWRKQWKGER